MNSRLTISLWIGLNQCVGVGCFNSAIYQVFNFKLVKFWQLVVVLNIGIIDGRVELWWGWIFLIIRVAPAIVGFVFTGWCCCLDCTTVELLHLSVIVTGVLVAHTLCRLPESWSTLGIWWRLAVCGQIVALINTLIFHVFIWVRKLRRLGSRVGKTWRAEIMESIVVDCNGNVTSACSIYHRRSTFIFSRVVLDLLIILLMLASGTNLVRLLFFQIVIRVEWCRWWSLIGIGSEVIQFFD